MIDTFFLRQQNQFRVNGSGQSQASRFCALHQVEGSKARFWLPRVRASAFSTTRRLNLRRIAWWPNEMGWKSGSNSARWIISRFPAASFNLIVHPVSNPFVPNVRPVWRECFRVLRQGGSLRSGFANQTMYIFDQNKAAEGTFVVSNQLPYSDLASRSEESLAALLKAGEPLEFSHTLEDQIGGQIDAGFVLAGFYEDRGPDRPLNQYIPLFVATRAGKP